MHMGSSREDKITNYMTKFPKKIQKNRRRKSEKWDTPRSLKMLISKSKYLIAFSCSYLKSTLNFDKKYPQNKNFLKVFFMYIPP